MTTTSNFIATFATPASLVGSLVRTALVLIAASFVAKNMFFLLCIHLLLEHKRRCPKDVSDDRKSNHEDSCRHCFQLKISENDWNAREGRQGLTALSLSKCQCYSSHFC